jgi:hypothetical protein
VTQGAFNEALSFGQLVECDDLASGCEVGDRLINGSAFFLSRVMDVIEIERLWIVWWIERLLMTVILCDFGARRRVSFRFLFVSFLFLPVNQS